MDSLDAQETIGFVFNESRPQSLTDNGVYYFTNEFTPGTVKDVITWILDSNLQTTNKFDNLTLILTSYGGDLFSAFALIDVMRGSAIPVHTVGLGIVASAALMTFIVGTRGHRIITPNTSILSHQWSGGSFGKEHELVATQKQFELTTTKVLNHYKRCTKLTEKVIRAKLLPPQDVWLSAEEAKTLNLVDDIKNLR